MGAAEMKVSALISAYFSADYLHKRLVNLQQQTVAVEPVVVCQRNSVEQNICAYHGVKPTLTDDIPSIGAAWNIAIEKAKGEYITTANTDDLFLPEGIETLAKALDDNPDCGLAFSQVYKYDGNQVHRWKRIPDPTGEVVGIKGLLMERCPIGPMPMWRKQIHRDIGRFVEAYVVASDYEMWLRMAKAGIKFWYIDEPLGMYLWRHDSLEHRNLTECAYETHKIQNGAL
jgi:O-antigen biosynthesis protein